MPSKKIRPRKIGANIDRLNPQQRMFVLHLLADETFNASKAALKAGYKNGGQMGHKLIQHPVISAAIGKAIADRARRVELQADDVLIHLKNALFLNVLDLFNKNEDGSYSLKDFEEIPVEVGRCINKLKSRTRYTKEGDRIVEVDVELMSKDTMMNLAMKHLNLLGEREEEVKTHEVDREILIHMLETVEARSNIIDARVIEQKVIEDGR